MPGKPDKPHRIRVRTLDGKSRDQGAINKLKSNQLGMPHLDIASTNVANEFVVCASKQAHIEQVRAKLGGAGVQEVPGGDTIVAASTAPKPNMPPRRQGGFAPRGGSPQRGGYQQGRRAPAATSKAPDLSKKPYGFVPLPKDLTSSPPSPPVWHDGTSSTDGLAGEIRFELETLTPLLVGWERQLLNDAEAPWSVPTKKVSRGECFEFIQAAARTAYPDANDQDEDTRRKKQQNIDQDRSKYVERIQDHIVNVELNDSGWSIDSKPVLCPLRAPWGKRPVILPGDSLKGLLRHELGALLGAPMERVAERSYSYRPNALFPKDPNPRLIARLARVPNNGVETKAFEGNHQVRVPKTLDLLPTNLRYDKRCEQSSNYYRFDESNGAPYRGGQGAGEMLNSKRNLHRKLTANPSAPTESATVSEAVQEGYLATLRHLVDLDHGHFSERHPDVPNTVKSDDARKRILEAAQTVVFQPGDLVWVEWDTENKCIVSLGWHYYYRWSYTDTVRRTAGKLERYGLFPLADERLNGIVGAPKRLSPVRRLFGYAGDKKNEGVVGIGKDDHAQLMGRISINAGLEVVGESDTDEQRFLPPTFLKELGMPRPSAVEHYLQQPNFPNPKERSDKAQLLTYGDAAGYDVPGELAGRKFYLDRGDAYTGEPWKNDSESNRSNDRSTLAFEASKPSRKFRFTMRFRDLDATELAATLVSLCPHQFKDALGGKYTDGYCSKLGYARPLGWGTVRIRAVSLQLLEDVGSMPTLKPEADLNGWVKGNHQKTSTQEAWLAVHRYKHPDATGYPSKDGQVYTFHSVLRAEHSRNRRYRKGGGP